MLQAGIYRDPTALLSHSGRALAAGRGAMPWERSGMVALDGRLLKPSLSLVETRSLVSDAYLPETRTFSIFRRMPPGSAVAKLAMA